MFRYRDLELDEAKVTHHHVLFHLNKLYLVNINNAFVLIIISIWSPAFQESAFFIRLFYIVLLISIPVIRHQTILVQFC